MADGTSDAVESATLEGPAAAWVGERAEEMGIEPTALLKRVVAAYRSVEDGDLAADVITREDAEALFEERVADRLETVESDVADVEDRVATAEDDFDEKLQDVRERVIQVKREADGKADADHEHPDLSTDLADAMAAVEDVEADVADLADDVGGVADHVDRGFENFEEVLTYLRDEVDDLHHRTTALASAVLSMRESLRALGAAEARRSRAERIQREANVAGVSEAECEECEQSVTIGQLTAPECPFCGAAFEDVQAKSGWFGTHTLQTGTTPALPAGQSWLDGDSEEDGWLGGESDSLKEMAAEEDESDGDDEPIAAEPVDAMEADAVASEEVSADVVDVGDATDQRAPTESDGGEPRSSGDGGVTDG